MDLRPEKAGARSPAGASGGGWVVAVYRNAGVVLFLALVAALAYVEEGFWESLVWREHSQVFAFFAPLPHTQDCLLLSVLVPLLTLPQVTHYVLDGFIWKVSCDGNLHPQ